MILIQFAGSPKKGRAGSQAIEQNQRKSWTFLQTSPPPKRSFVLTKSFSIIWCVWVIYHLFVFFLAPLVSAMCFFVMFLVFFACGRLRMRLQDEK